MTSKYELSTLDALKDQVADLPQMDNAAAEAAQTRQNSLTKPPGALGRLEDMAIFMAAWQGVEKPVIDRAQAVVFAGNHGVCAQGVNPFPQEVTSQMVANFEAGGAAINQLCRANGAELSVIAIELDRPTRDFTVSQAMTEQETIDAFNKGAQAVDTKSKILVLGEMGIGNSTVAAALANAVFGGAAIDWVGRGTGSDDDGVSRKVSAVERGVERHKSAQGLGILAALGGREQAAICGAIVAARSARIPVMLDGYICTAAAAPLFAVSPNLLDHCLVGHRSVEPGHMKLLAAMKKDPVLDFDMRLGEGSGAALALGVLRSALECHNGMATFAEAGVSGG